MTDEHRSAVGATWSGIRDLFVTRREVGPLAAEDRIEGTTALVTGGTSGLGRAVAAQLAERGARVVVTGRRPRGWPPFTGETEVGFLPLDLTDLSTIHSFVETCRTHRLRFDRVVQNAGMVAQRSRLTQDGFDEMEQVNVLSAAAMVSALMEAGVLSGPDGGPKPRLIVVGSESHRSAEPVDVDTVGRPRIYGAGGAVAEYGRTKLLLTAYAVTFGRRCGRAVDVFVMCPGAVNSEIAREAPRWSKPLLKAVFATIFQSPARAAEPAVYLACAAPGTEPPGRYLHLMRRRAPSEAATDVDFGDRLWARIYDLLGPQGFVAPRSD